MKKLFSDRVKFQPFIGENYFKSPSKILLLGESHYSEHENNPHFTSDVVSDYIDKNSHSKFFGGMLRALYGEITDVNQQFRQLSFYNYIQEVVGPKHNDRPTDTMWCYAQAPFWEVLSVLQPDTILCFGKVLYANLPNCGEPGSTFSNDKLTIKSWKYICKKPIAVYGLTHPSYKGGFNASDYHELLCTIPQLNTLLSVV